jgi:hypothetical protein
MNRTSVSPQPKSKAKPQKGPSAALTDFLKAKYDGKVPVAALTAASKLYGKGRPLKKEDRTLKRLSTNTSEIAVGTLSEFLSTNPHEKGKGLSEEAVRRVFGSFANEGKLSFEYVLKMGESSGVAITEKVAKLIVRKYGRRKDHLGAEDCLALVQRRTSQSAGRNTSQSAGRNTSKSPKK